MYKITLSHKFSSASATTSFRFWPCYPHTCQNFADLLHNYQSFLNLSKHSPAHCTFIGQQVAPLLTLSSSLTLNHSYSTKASEIKVESSSSSSLRKAHLYQTHSHFYEQQNYWLSEGSSKPLDFWNVEAISTVFSILGFPLLLCS